MLLGDRIMVMTAQPGRVKRSCRSPLARPRNIMELQRRREYGELVHRIWSGLRDEVHARAPAGGGDRSHERAAVATVSDAPRGNMSRAHARPVAERDLAAGAPALWEFCARFGFIDTRFFPAPSSVVSTMVEMLGTGELVTHTAVSMQRLLYGTIIGGVPALVLGIAMDSTGRSAPCSTR